MLPLSGRPQPPGGVSFSLALGSADKVTAVRENGTLLQSAGGGSYKVKLPPSLGAPASLLKYSAVQSWRPIPLKVVPEWRSGADGTARLQLLVAPHPGLKGGLQNVSLVVSAAGATGLASSEPAAEWLGSTQQLRWREAALRPRPPSQPYRFVAVFSGVLSAPPTVQVSFSCDGDNPTGLRATPGADATPSVAAAVQRRFVAGQYSVACDGPAA